MFIIILTATSLDPRPPYPLSSHLTSHYTVIIILELYDFISPEFSYRPGLMSGESTATASTNQSSGPPNRPLPPTPDDDAQGDRTLIMKRVSDSCNFFIKSTFFYIFFTFKRNIFFILLHTYIYISFAHCPLFDVSVKCSFYNSQKIRNAWGFFFIHLLCHNYDFGRW